MHTASDIPTTEPIKIRAGETLKWTKDLSAHYTPADGWSLAYYVNGPVHKAYTATASGVLFLTTIAAADTAEWPAGDYWWEARVSKDGEVYTVASGTWVVEANVTSLEDGYDGRTNAKKILDAHEASYLQSASRIEQSYSLSAVGRSFTYATKADLIAAIQYWKGVVAQEVAAEKIARGLNTGNNILVRFR